MGGSSLSYGITPISFHFKTHNFSSKHSKFLSFNSSSLPNLQFCRKTYPKSKVAQTVYKIGKDGVEAGANLVPEAVPRPVARLSVTVVATTLSLFVLKSFVSTVLFALGFMGFLYFIYIALNKDK